jgi:hypothetical protein
MFMPEDAATSDNDNTTDVAATDDNVSTDDNGADANEDKNEDSPQDSPEESDGGFKDFLDDVLSDEPVGTGDDSTTGDSKDDKKDDKKTDVINVADVEADDATDTTTDADTPTDKPDPKDTQINAQADQIKQLMNMIQESNKPAEPEPEPEVDIFEDESFSNLAEILDVDDKGKKALQTFFTKFMDHTQKSSLNQMLNQTPDMIGKVMDSKTQIENVKTKFYTENAELAAVKPFVKELANSIAQENPALDLAQVLEETSKKAYKVLGLTKKKPEDKKKGKEADPDNPDAGGDKDKKKKPAFPKGNNVRKPPVKQSKLEGDLDAMLKTLD